jgi:hypothetical protein
MRLAAVALVSLAGALPVAADTFVVPPAYENSPGTAGFLGPLSGSARTYQLLIHEDQLTSLLNHHLSGVAFRSTTGATAVWPAVDVTYQNYDLYLSPSVPPIDRSFTFAQNIAGPQVQVRSGPLTVPAESYNFGSSPNAYGPVIEFTQPYSYTGGHLLVELRQSGSDGNSRSVDAIGTSIVGYGDQFRAIWVGSYTGTTTTSQGNFAVIQFTATPGDLCYANCDNSTVEPVLNVEDFICFVSEFAQGIALPSPQQITHYANCDDSTTEPVLNVEDFICFVSAFAAGCP